MPPATWDCHVHVFDPARFAYSDNRNYTPGLASLDDLRDRHREWDVANTVLVQPSVYGTDNSCLLDALCALGPRGRAVAVVDPDRITDEQLADMKAAGVVGMRANLVSSHDEDGPDPFRKLARRLQGSGMFLQIYAPLERILQETSVLESVGLPVVLDHFAGATATTPPDHLTELAVICRNLPVWIKLSADYRLAEAAAAQRKAARDLIGRFWSIMPDRLIWGSDWPHTGGGSARKARPMQEIELFRDVNGLSVPRLLQEAGLSNSDLRQVLSANPINLFSDGCGDSTQAQPKHADKKGDPR